jgi:hypothetical protein
MWMIERLLEMGLYVFILFCFITVVATILSYPTNEPPDFDHYFFEFALMVPFIVLFLYFITLYGISCVLFGLIFRNPTPRRHAKIMVAAFCVHLIGYFLFLMSYSLYRDGPELGEILMKRVLPISIFVVIPGIPAVWIANYAGGVFYRWAIARSGKTTLTS